MSDLTPAEGGHGGGELITADAVVASRPRAGHPSDNTTLAGILDGLAEHGFEVGFDVAVGGQLHCPVCDVTSDAGSFGVDAIRRLEGASDPDDMMSVVAARCPSCRAAGTVVLGYGPTASDEDLDVSSALPRG